MIPLKPQTNWQVYVYPLISGYSRKKIQIIPEKNQTEVDNVLFWTQPPLSPTSHSSLGIFSFFINPALEIPTKIKLYT